MLCKFHVFVIHLSDFSIGIFIDIIIGSWLMELTPWTTNFSLWAILFCKGFLGDFIPYGEKCGSKQVSPKGGGMSSLQSRIWCGSKQVFSKGLFMLALIVLSSISQRIGSSDGYHVSCQTANDYNLGAVWPEDPTPPLHRKFWCPRRKRHNGYK